MLLKKKNKNVLISSLNQKELFGFLKVQIPLTLAFFDVNQSEVLDYRLTIGERLSVNGKQVITVNNVITNYDKLLELIVDHSKNSLIVHIEMLIIDFKNNEPLIQIIAKLKESIVSACVCLEYSNNIFSIINRPFKNGDSDKLYYFENNDSVLAFIENGPVIIKDPKINSVVDVFCDK